MRHLIAALVLTASCAPAGGVVPQTSGSSDEPPQTTGNSDKPPQCPSCRGRPATDVTCIPYACCDKNDCGEGEECLDNRCQPPEPGVDGGTGCHRLLQSGPDDEKLNIVFITAHNNGTTAKSLAKTVPAYRDTLFAFDFWLEYHDRINISYAFTNDASDGCIAIGEPLKNTPYCDRLAVEARAAELCGYSHARGDQLVVIFPETDYPEVGGRSPDGHVYITDRRPDLFGHEFSHAVGGLADTGSGTFISPLSDTTYPNCASDAPGHRCADKWGDLIGTTHQGQVVGCFAGCQYAANWYRPTEAGDVMSITGVRFYDAVAERALRGILDRYK